MSAGHRLPIPEPTRCDACGLLAVPGETCPITVHCAHCNAAPGTRCYLPNGHASPALHMTRREHARFLDAVEALD